MKREDLKVLIIRIVGTFPSKVQKIVLRTLIETRYIIFRMKCALALRRNTANPAKIYWISPNRIIKCLSPEDRKGYFDSEKVRGKIVGGNWDLTKHEFTSTIDVYEAFRKRVEEGVEWRDTEYYRRILRQVKSGDFIYGIRNKADLDRRCEYLDSLYESIRNEGYLLSRYNYHENITFGEITVNIGRNGEYIFRDGIHRFSIAKLIGLKYVPVMVFVRHNQWQEFRDFLSSHAQRQCGEKLYQPPIHPDLADVPYSVEHRDCEGLMKAIKLHLGKETGVMLDIGANIGFYCHKFEDLGYHCYAVERDPVLCYIMQRIRIAEDKEFQVINKSIFDVEFIKDMEFDVVLALNVFHHFLKTKATYSQFIDLLKNLKTDELFFEPHRFEEDQMKDAYVNYRETEFVNFLLENTSLTKSEIIYTDKNGRHVFKLFR